MANPLRHKHLFPVCLAVVLVLSGCTAGSVGAGILDRTPYRFVPRFVVGGIGARSRNPWNPSSMVIAAPEGGGDWILKTIPMGPRCQTPLYDSWPTIWMEPYPAAFNGDKSLSVVDGVWPFGPDREPEVVFHAFLPDRSRVVFQRHRIGNGQIQARFEMTTGQDRDGNGVWDGNIRVAGVLDVPTPKGPRRAMILISTAGRDLQPRGVQAVDAQTGELLWDYFVGPQPYGDSYALADLDGDGTREVIFAGSAVGNIHAGSFHGTRDDTSRVFVLGAAGHLRWSRPFAPYSSRVFITAIGARGDSPAQIVAGVLSGQAGSNGLYLLDGSGGLIDRLPVPSGVRNMARWSADGQGEGLVAVAGTGTVVRFSSRDSLRITAQRRLPEPVQIVGVMDMVPEPGLEILLQGRGHWVLSSSLDILAHDPSPDPILSMGGLGFFHTDRDSVLMYGQGPDGAWAFEMVPVPNYLGWGVGGGLLALVAAVPLARRRRRRGRPTDATRRELQLQLLDRLKLSGHGAIGGLSAVRRLVWNLNAMAQGFTLAADRMGTLRDLLADIETHQLPKLEAAVELARLGELDPASTDLAARSLATLKRKLGDAGASLGGETGPGATVQDLKDAAEAAEHAFQELRKQVEDVFRVDPAAIVAQSLAAHEESIAAARVAVATDLEAVPACCMDGEELAFVIDNLIENAVRAMRGGRDPRLVIDWKQSDRWLTLRFADTGCGIVPDDWQRIFEAGQTTREGGGLGLSRSREILRKFGGGLMVEKSELGKGTVMALTLAVPGRSRS